MANSAKAFTDELAVSATKTKISPIRTELLDMPNAWNDSIRRVSGDI
jgi:hypothetical protein